MPQPAGDEISIRPLAPEDAEGVLHVHHAAVHRTAAADYPPDVLRDWSPPVTAERLERYRQNLAREDETTLVAVAGGRIVGFASIVAALAELRALYVSPDLGRRGVGASLLHGVEELARERGLEELHLDASLTAERFYSRYGYESQGRATHTLRTGVRMACVRMRKRLNPARRPHERLGFTVVGEPETDLRMQSPPPQGDATRRPSDTIRVRLARHEDLEVLERELPLHTPSRHRECLADQAEGRLAYLVAWQGSAPVGHGLIHWPGPRNAAVREHLPDCPEIFMLGVPEALRSQGIGRALIARLEKVAAARGKRCIGLGVAVTNPRARSLYERLGYREVGAPSYVDRWYWVDPSGMERVEEDPCVFLVKALPAA